MFSFFAIHRGSILAQSTAPMNVFSKWHCLNVGFAFRHPVTLQHYYLSPVA